MATTGGRRLMRSALWTLCAALLLSCASWGAVEAEAAGLFSTDNEAVPLRRTPERLRSEGPFPEGGRRGGMSSGFTPSAELRSRIADMDFGRLAAARSEAAQGRPSNLRLNLFADADFDAVFERTSPTASGYTLTGRLADDPLGTVVLAVNGRHMSGLVWGVSGRHSIQAWGGGGALIRHEVLGNSPVCAGPVQPPSSQSAAASAEPQRKANALNFPLDEAAPPDDGEVIDVLVVYTPLVRGLSGGHRAMRATIDRDVAMANEAYRVGGAAQRINLVAAVEVGHQGAPEWLEHSTGGLDGTLLDHLRDRDGVLDEVLALRDSYAADLALMHTGDLVHITAGPKGGIAYGPKFVPSEDSASLGFSVSNSKAFTHELGHNMGLFHERGQDNSNLPFPYSHGYLIGHYALDGDPYGTIGTIMATVQDRLPRFSNPKQTVTRGGQALPLGVPGDEPSDSVDGPADAVRSLNGTRRAVANFRASAGRCAYSLSPEFPVLSAAGGEFRVRVETAPGCQWTALSDGGFLAVAEGSGGAGDGEVVYRVPANEGWEREAALLIAGEVYLVRQRGVRPITPVCERTPAVSKAVSEAAGRPCAEVTASDLASVGSLFFRAIGESDLPQPGDFDGLSNLSALSVDRGNIGPGVLEPGVFDGLANLRHLELYRFASFKSGLFDGLGRLIELRLHETQKLVVTPELFDGLSNLLELSFVDSGATTLAPDVFSGLSNLRVLRLSSNPIADLPPGVFNGLPKLYFLHATNMRLTILRAGVFDGLANLVFMGFWENTLTTLQPGVFDGLAKLEYLYFENNRIAALFPGTFDGLEKLPRLNLQNNRIATLSPGAFDGMPRLSGLNLSGNRLSVLPSGLFAEKADLFGLDLSDNQLTGLPSGLFAGTRLYELNLSGNQIDALPSGLFAGGPTVGRLNLASNLLRTLPSGLFDGLDFADQMEFLALEDNPGAPFSFTAEFVRPSRVGSASPGSLRVMPEVAQGAPFNMRIGLSAKGGALSSAEALIAKGAVRGEAVSVMPTGRAPVTLAMTDVTNDASRVIPISKSCGHLELWWECHSGFRTAAGPPLVLNGLPDQTLAGNGTVKFDLPSAFPNFPAGTAFAVELDNPAVAEAAIAGGLLTVASTGGGTTTVAVTATAPDGRRAERTFRVTVESAASSYWGGWRSVLLQSPPSEESDG